jgi:hypothetical protein
MKTKKKIILLLIALSNLCISQNDCDVTTASIDTSFFPGPPVNFIYSGTSPTSIYLCNNALVYDSANCISDRVVIIQSGAKYIWKQCGAMASGIYIKSGGTLTLLPEVFPTATTIYYEPGATIINAPGNTAPDMISCPQLLFPSKNCATGLSELTTEKLISIYPNPTRGNIRILLLSNNSLDVKSFCITDSYGRKVDESSFYNSLTEIATSKLCPGLYQILLTTNSGVIVKRFIRTD